MNSAEAKGLQKSLAYSFLVFVVASTFSIALAQLALGVSVFLFLILFWRERPPLLAGEMKTLYLLTACLVAWYILTALVGGSPLKSLNSMREAWLFCAVPVGIRVMQKPDHRRMILGAFVTAVLLVALYGLLQYLFGLNWFKSAPLNEATGFGYKIRGNFTHRLTFGNYFGTAAAFLLGLGLATGPMLTRRQRATIFAAAFLAGMAVILTFSRTVAVALAVTAILAGLAHGRRGGLAVIGAVLTAGVIAWLTVPGISSRFTGQSSHDLSTDYEGGRLFIWSRSVDIIADNPVFGVGPGNFPEAYAARLRPDIEEHRKLSHAHNDFLDIAAKSGVPGALLFAALWVLVLRKQLSLYRRSTTRPEIKGLALAGLLGSVLFLMSSMTEATFADEEVRQLLMFVWAVGLVGLYKENNVDE